MLNLYEDIRISHYYKKFVAGDLLFTEYTCPIGKKSIGIWTHTDYIVHVVSGRKAWHTSGESYLAEAGQTLYLKKGAAIVEQFFDEAFCLLLFFIPDDFIRNIVSELRIESKLPSPGFTKQAIRINNDAALSMYFKTMLTYFASIEKPSEALLKLKLKELILSILESSNNPELKEYFLRLHENQEPLLSEIMENNFRYNLTLENYAEMCHKSLSSFKRDFYNQYHTAPGKWLLNKRLEYSAALLKSGNLSISEAAFESGFENLSHFSQAFRNKFGLAPLRFKKQHYSVLLDKS